MVRISVEVKERSRQVSGGSASPEHRAGVGDDPEAVPRQGVQGEVPHRSRGVLRKRSKRGGGGQDRGGRDGGGMSETWSLLLRRALSCEVRP